MTYSDVLRPGTSYTIDNSTITSKHLVITSSKSLNNIFSLKYRLKSLISKNKLDSLGCQYGWDYDKSRWTETSVSFFNLVCDDASSVTTIFSLAVAGNALGTLLLSILSDRWVPDVGGRNVRYGDTYHIDGKML